MNLCEEELYLRETYTLCTLLSTSSQFHLQQHQIPIPLTSLQFRLSLSRFLCVVYGAMQSNPSPASEIVSMLRTLDRMVIGENSPKGEYSSKQPGLWQRRLCRSLRSRWDLRMLY
jgi:hypothetical protein